MDSRQVLNQVEFKFTRNAYPTNEKVFCYFSTVTPQGSTQHQPQGGDWIGLFKVGWKNLRECITRKFVSIEAIEGSKKINIDYTHVVFEQIELPKEKEGFYQFVYVTKGDLVRGASRPFQLEMETTELKGELKELKREMWNTIQEREQWSKIVSEREPWSKIVIEREPWTKVDEREQQWCKQVEQQREQREQQTWSQVVEEREQRERSLPRRSCSNNKMDFNNNTTVVELSETDLLREISNGRQWEKLSEESIVNKLIQKYLTSVRSKKDEDFVKRFEELFVENKKLSSSLKKRMCEVLELKKECQELKYLNSEVLNKLTNGERKVELLERELEREREVLRRRLEEQKEVLPSIYERSMGKHQHYLIKDIESEEAKAILREENERLREELRRLTTMYQTESQCFTTLKNKLMKIDESLVNQLNKRLNERKLSEVEETTLVEIKALKNLIDELRSENESLKARMRFDLNECVKPVEQSFPITLTKLVKEKTMTVPKVNSQPEFFSLIETRPIVGETYPSISVSTSIPEITSRHQQQQHHQQSQSIMGCGKVPTGPMGERMIRESEKIMREQIREDQQIRESLNELYLSKIEEQLKKKSIEEQLKTKLEKMKEMKEMRELPCGEKCVEYVYGNKESKTPSYMVISSTTTSGQSTPCTEELLQKQIVRQQQKHFLKQYEEQSKHHLREQQQQQLQQAQQQLNGFTTICPVCGIAVSKELNQIEFELHVNSHFSD